MDRFSLRDKVSVVTGGNRGIGRAIAVGFAEAGSSIAIVACDEAASSEALEELRALGVPAIAVRADVANRDDFELGSPGGDPRTRPR